MVGPSWFSFILYNPIKIAFTDRNKVIRESCVNPICIVFEVGAGNDFLTETLAEREILNLYKIALNTIYDD